MAVFGCATLRQVAALRRVDFSLDHVSDFRLAGIELASVRSWEDLSVTDAGRLAVAVAQQRLPLDLQLHVLAVNPADAATDARMVRMDWTLLIRGRETLSGAVEDEMLLPRGQPRDIPVTIRLNLVDFFEGGARDLFDVARSLVGLGGEPGDVALRATPVIDTPLGPVSYPEPITIGGG